MEEDMDTTIIISSDDDQAGHSTQERLRMDVSMDVSPILEQPIVHNVQRTRRSVVVSSDGWISTRPAGHLPPDVAFEIPASTSNLQVHEVVDPEDHQVREPVPPPIEDTDLIMIHRPVSPNHAQAGVLNEVQENAATGSGHHNMDFGNDGSPPQPESSTADIVPESVLGDDQETEPAEETSRDSGRNSVEIHPPGDPDVENLPLAQRIRSPDLLPPVPSPPPKRAKIVEEPAKTSDSGEEDEGNLCPICFDAWTNSGAHRLISLRCGHLFGHSCITHWLSIHKQNDRKCPQCKKKVTAKDIRPLYASKLKVLDTSELEALKETVKNLEDERDRLTRELTYERQMHQNAIKMQQEQELKLQQLQNRGILTHSFHQPLSSTVADIAAQIKISLTNRVEVARDGGCRVLAFNEWKGVLVASQSSVTPLFPDFGIRLIDIEGFGLRQLFPMHSKAIRDLSFNPHRKDLLLSTSLDKTSKMFCMSSNASVLTFNAEVPLWSCTWDGNNSNIFFVGSQNGITFQYDIRNAHSEVSRISTPGECAPVISLAAIPAGPVLPHGGFLSCRLNRLRVYERTSNSEFKEHPLNIEGPFSALNYNHKTHHMLVSTRPTFQSPHVQHQLYELGFSATQPRTNIVHSFVGGTTQRIMSRPCQIEVDGAVKDTLVCAHQESEGHIAIWSISSGQKVPAGPLHCSEPILDLCPLKVNNTSFLASLSEKTLRVYQFS